MTDHPTIDPWQSLGGVAQAILRRPDPPTIAEQIDAVEWAEAQVTHFGKIARLGAAQTIDITGHRRGLSKHQLETLRIRLEAAVETLKSLDYFRSTLA